MVTLPRGRGPCALWQCLTANPHHPLLPRRCFPECAQLDVRLVAAWLPRTVCGGLTVLCAILRMWALAVLLLWTRIASRAAPQVIVVDQARPHRRDRGRWTILHAGRQKTENLAWMQVAAVVPLLRLAARRVVFYGHFPDQLLASHASPLRRAYRAPFDALERLCTAAAHRVLVNSEYTRRVYADTFGASSAGARADVLYPCVGVPSEAEAAEGRKGWRQGAESAGSHALLLFMQFNSTFRGQCERLSSRAAFLKERKQEVFR